MKVLRTYRLADLGSGLIDETAQLKLVAQATDTSDLDYIPITGTKVGNPITGDREVNMFTREYFIDNESLINEIVADDGAWDFRRRNEDYSFDQQIIIGAPTGIESNTDFSEINPENELIYAQRKYVDNINKPIVVSSSQTAILNRVHNVVATATLTDPTPTEGMGYLVNVINGVATVGGVAYSVGSELYRHYHSGSWRTFEHLVNRNKLLTLTSNYSLADQTAYQKIFNIDDSGGSAGTVNVVAGTYLAFFNLAFNGLPAGLSQVRLRLNNGSATISVYSASVSSSTALNSSPSGQFSFIDNTLVGTFIPTTAGGVTSRSIGFFAMINFTTAGTFLPEFGITASTAGMTVLANSFFTLTKI